MTKPASQLAAEQATLIGRATRLAENAQIPTYEALNHLRDCMTDPDTANDHRVSTASKKLEQYVSGPDIQRYVEPHKSNHVSTAWREHEARIARNTVTDEFTVQHEYTDEDGFPVIASAKVKVSVYTAPGQPADEPEIDFDTVEVTSTKIKYFDDCPLNMRNELRRAAIERHGAMG